MRTIPMSVMEAHDVPVESDAAWQRTLRLLQSLWRAEHELPMGVFAGGPNKGKPLGCALDAETAERDGLNFLTPSITEVVRRELDRDIPGRVIEEGRLWGNMLSSQPLCFNLFGELAAEDGFATATAWARVLWPERVAKVTDIRFEYSPGRGDDRYLGNGTAFDVYLEHETPSGGRGFIGIEVKYHEDLSGKAYEAGERLREVATQSGVFASIDDPELHKPPLQQVWFDHLLVHAIRGAEPEWETGLFVFLHPMANVACRSVAPRYVDKLQHTSTFQPLTLEDAVAALDLVTDAKWVVEFRRRYLDYQGCFGPLLDRGQPSPSRHVNEPALRVGKLQVPMHLAEKAVREFCRPGQYAYAKYDLAGGESARHAFSAEDLRRPRHMNTPPSNAMVSWLEVNAVPVWLELLPDDPDLRLDDLSEDDVRRFFRGIFEPLGDPSAPRGRNTREALHSKILHVKRPQLVPVFDSVIHRAYAGMGDGDRRYWKTIYRRRPENIVRFALHVRDAVGAQRSELERLSAIAQEDLGIRGPTPLRCLDIVGWMYLNGYVSA